MSSYLRPITKENPYKLVFVCLGNICRSPTGEGIFIHKVNEAGLESYFYIDSSGTAAYHTGERADRRSQETANDHGIRLPSIARRFEYADLEEFDLILAMDSSNLKNILDIDKKGKYSDKVKLLREFDPIPDPYYGGAMGFENVFQMVERSCDTLLNELKEYIQD